MTRAFAVVVLVAACSDYQISPTEKAEDIPVPEILVEPPSIDFGTQTSNVIETRSIRITNVGDAALNIEDVFVNSDPEFALTDAGLWGFFLEPSDWVEFDVAFYPQRMGLHEGWVTVYSDGHNETESVVNLLGDGAVPSLVIEPNPVDFRELFIGCFDEQLVTMTNTGDEQLHVEGLDWWSTGEIAMMPVTELTPPFDMEAGEIRQFMLRYDAYTEGNEETSLLVTSNDPAGGVEHISFGNAVYAAKATQEYVVPDNPSVDLLFAVDQSCSMDSHASRLASGFSLFINDINNVTTDWHIGVVTKNSACFNHGVLTANTPNYIGLFEDGVTQGGEHGLTEKLLELTNVSLQQTTNGCNANFLRPGALLHVIVVSDEKEQSNQTPASWIAQYESYVSTPQHLKISAVVDYDAACPGAGGASVGAAGYDEAVALTGGELLNICLNDWGPQLAQLAAASLTTIPIVELDDANPDPVSIQVTVDGSPSNDWHYDDIANAVVFDIDLEAGQVIVVDYGVLADCN